MYVHLLVSTRKKLLVYIEESSKTYNKQNCNEKTVGQKFNDDEKEKKKKRITNKMKRSGSTKLNQTLGLC